MDNLGKKAQDKITGFKGIITSKHIYLTGCSQYGIQPLVGKDGKLGDKEYFDEGRIKILGPGVNKKDVQSIENGSDHRDRPSRS